MTRRISLIVPLEREYQFEQFSSIFVMPRYGPAAIATKLVNSGYEVRVFSEFARSCIDFEYVLSSDYICFSLMSFCALKGYSIADQIKRKTNVPIIFGGCHPSVLPEDCLEHCDYVVRNEGEETIVYLLDAIENKRDIEKVDGISYKNQYGQCVHNKDREFTNNIDFPINSSLINGYKPANLNPVEEFLSYGYITYHPIQTSRGCPCDCSFCHTPRELGKKYRTKSIETVISDIRRSSSKTFIFTDTDLTLNRVRAKELLKRLIKEFNGEIHITAFSRIEVCKDRELLNLMKDAGIKLLYLGIESINEHTLESYKKGQNVSKIIEAVSIIQAQGISIVATFVFGSDYDTIHTVRDTVQFAIRNDFSQLALFPVYDFPTQNKVLGTHQMFPDNRFIHHDWRFYNANFVIHYPKKMKPSSLQKEIISGYLRFHSWSRALFPNYRFISIPLMLARLLRVPAKIIPGKDFMIKHEVYGVLGRRIFILNPIIRTMKRYVKVLEALEEGLYDENENLIEENLPPYEVLRMRKKISL